MNKLHRYGRNCAVKIGRLNGRNVYRVPVRIRHNDSRACATIAEREFTVTAYSATDAANWARDNACANLPETEIEAVGPKGGLIHRYIGWETSVFQELVNQARAADQLTLI